MKVEFPGWIFQTILKYQTVLKSVQWEQLLHVDKQTDMMKLIIAF